MNFDIVLLEKLAVLLLLFTFAFGFVAEHATSATGDQHFHYG